MDQLQSRLKQLNRTPLWKNSGRIDPAAKAEPTAPKIGSANRTSSAPAKPDDVAETPMNLSFKDFKDQQLQVSGTSTSTRTPELVEKISKKSKIEAYIKEEVDALVRTSEEVECVREIKDILDELGSVSAVFEAEERIIKHWEEDDKDHSTIKLLLNTIQERHRDIQQKTAEAERVHRHVSILIHFRERLLI
jgi:hypothetical protein